jgi:hypothetical protein
MCVSVGTITKAVALSRKRHTWDPPDRTPKERGISGLFSRDKSTVEATISLYNGQRRKYSKPVFKFTTVTQAFAVYPEQPEFIGGRTLIKLEGTCCAEKSLHSREREGYEGWMLLKPDLKGTGADEILRWLIGEDASFAKSFWVY